MDAPTAQPAGNGSDCGNNCGNNNNNYYCPESYEIDIYWTSGASAGQFSHGQIVYYDQERTTQFGMALRSVPGDCFRPQITPTPLAGSDICAWLVARAHAATIAHSLCARADQMKEVCTSAIVGACPAGLLGKWDGISLSMRDQNTTETQRVAISFDNRGVASVVFGDSVYSGNYTCNGTQMDVKVHAFSCFGRVH